jgi:hypothetical protein
MHLPKFQKGLVVVPLLSALALAVMISSCSESGPGVGGGPSTGCSTTIDTSPAAVFSASSGQFTFSSPDAHAASFECQLNNGGYSTCTSPYSFSGLTLGSQVFDVRCIDATGTAGTRESHTWTYNQMLTHLAGLIYSEGHKDGTGNAARFAEPGSGAIVSGSLYLADKDNHVIRKIDLTTLEATTFAGTAGSSGTTDATRTSATFDSPVSVYSDGTDLFVADFGNHTIRQISIATAEVTTLAGTAGTPGDADATGTSAEFNYPFDITGDGTNLYVTDRGNHTIRKIVKSSGVVTTLAGTAGTSGDTDATGTSAEFYSPEGIEIVGGDLYVADYSNHSIRKIVISSEVVTTFAGTSGSNGTTDDTGTAARFNYPTGIYSDGTNIYVTDKENRTIRKIVIATGVVTTFAGTAGTTDIVNGTGTAANFLTPRGLAGDGTDLYVSDGTGIRKIVISSGVVTSPIGEFSIAKSSLGTGANAKFAGVQGLTSDGTYLYASENSSSGSAIKKIDPTTGVVTLLAGGTFGTADGTGAAAEFKYPMGMVVVGDYIYLVDEGNHAIRKINTTTGVTTTFAGLKGTSGDTDATGTAARFKDPYDITSDGTNLFVADRSNHTIRQIVISSGVVTTLAGNSGTSGDTDATGTSAEFNSPVGVTTDGTNVYVVDQGNDVVRKVVIATGVVTTFAGTSGSNGFIDGVGTSSLLDFGYREQITTDGTYLYIVEQRNYAVRRIEISTGTVTKIIGSDTNPYDQYDPMNITAGEAYVGELNSVHYDSTFGLFFSTQYGIKWAKFDYE